MTENIKILKVKTKSNGKLFLEYEQQRAGYPLKLSGEHPFHRHPDLDEALQKLKSVVVNVNKLNQDAFFALEITGVTISENDDNENLSGALVTAVLTTEAQGKTTAINTPFIRYNGSESFSRELEELVGEVVDEAKAYLGGKWFERPDLFNIGGMPPGGSSDNGEDDDDDGTDDPSEEDTTETLTPAAQNGDTQDDDDALPVMTLQR